MASQKIELSTETRRTLNQHNLSPLWEIEEEELGANQDDLQANIWKWDDIKAAINRFNEDLPQGFHRRVIVPVNTSYGAAVSHTIYVGIHIVSPGGTAPPHRHSGNVLRFTIDGDPEMKTTVGGEDFPMRDNDLVTTPQWEWHGHVNESDETVIWLDVLDIPLMFDALNLDNIFEPKDDDSQPINRQMGYYESKYGDFRPPINSSAIPGPFEGIREPTPPYRFKWTDISESLNDAENNEGAYDEYDGIVLEYTNPARGRGPLFPTFGVRAQRLLDGKVTHSHSHNATEVYYVIDGEWSDYYRRRGTQLGRP